MAHALYPECLPNHCQGLCRTFPKICTKFDAYSLSHSLWNHIRQDSGLQTRGCKKIRMSTQLHELYTASQDIVVLSFTIALCYYNCCTDCNTCPGNYASQQ
jgi:hypothetical protein